MKTLVLFFLAGENMRVRYQASMSAAGIDLRDVDLLMVTPGAGSAVNEAYVLSSPGTGARLENVARRMGALPLERYERVVLVSFSAGYGAVRIILEEEVSARAVDAVVLLDSAHDALGTPRLDWLERYGRRAAAGEVLLWLAHTDVPTPYASTTDVADELCRRLAVENPDPNSFVDVNGLRVYDVDGRPPAEMRGEHADALVRWGDEFVAEALVRLRDIKPANVEFDPEEASRTWLGDTGPAVRAWQLRLGVTVDGWHGPQLERATQVWLADQYAGPDASHELGARLSGWLGLHLGIDPREVPGPTHHPLIVRYSEACRRGGVFLGVDEDGLTMWHEGVPLRAPSDEWAWCAIGQSRALQMSLLPHERPPHGLRVAVTELYADAVAAGTWEPAGSGYVPEPGDSVVLTRGGQDPTLGGQGHTRAVILVDGDSYWGIGGNEANAWQHGRHPLEGPAVKGWIRRARAA